MEIEIEIDRPPLDTDATETTDNTPMSFEETITRLTGSIQTARDNNVPNNHFIGEPVSNRNTLRSLVHTEPSLEVSDRIFPGASILDGVTRLIPNGENIRVDADDSFRVDLATSVVSNSGMRSNDQHEEIKTRLDKIEEDIQEHNRSVAAKLDDISYKLSLILDI